MIFSLFGKKDRQQTSSGDKDASRAKCNTSAPRPSDAKSGSRPAAVKRDAQAARATALKIDAIESEMSSEFVNLPTTIQPGNTIPGPATTVPKTGKPSAAPAPPKARAETAKPPSPPTLQPMSAGPGATTEFLLDGTSTVGNIAELSSEAAAVIEEAAIMYANGQAGLAEQMLQNAIAEDLLGNATQRAWWMLFDLYQIGGKQQEFERLSIDYVNKFETSPPAWIDGMPQTAAQTATPLGATPAVPFTGKLDDGCAKQVERIRKLAENHRALRLEFARVTEVDAAGCGLLLGVLKTLQKSEHDLVLVGAAELVARIRAILEVGRRDSEDAWLLLLEILRLLNHEKEFEETSIDYCVTFEVSPPAFVAPHSKVTTAQAEPAAKAAQADSFTMPALVEGRVDNLILAIAAYSDEHEPAVIDCSQLVRVDFAAAGRLLTGLAPFCGNGKAIEFHQVNHLVAELFNVIGLKDIVRILPRRN